MQYKEDKLSTFQNNGKLYLVNSLLESAHHLPSKSIPLTMVDWVLEYVSLDPSRVDKSDYKVPILVFFDKDQQLWVVADGAHRVCKAKQDGLRYIPAKILTAAMLQKAYIPENQHHIYLGA